MQTQPTPFWFVQLYFPELLSSSLIPGLFILQAGYPPLLSFQMALDTINANATLLPNHQLVGWINSTNQETGQAVAGAYFLVPIIFCLAL
jgi:hypothetical protein